MESQKTREKKEKSKKNNALILIAVASVLVMVLPTALADSYELYCLDEGEVLPLSQICGPSRTDRVGPLTMCMHLLDNGKICPTNPNTCNNLGLGCSGSANTTVDHTPPVMNVNSPADGEVYNERSIVVIGNFNENVDFKYRYTDEGGSWKNLCSGCNTYGSPKTFKEGPNTVTFRATDGSGNEAFVEREFYVDSKLPRINSVEPSSGLASGEFLFRFTEDNPSELMMNYGNQETGFRTQGIEIESCSEGTNRECLVLVDLTDYDGQFVEFYFSVEDIAGNIVNSAVNSLLVDFSEPVIDELVMTVQGKYVTFDIFVDEPSFEEVSYIDLSASTVREKALCNTLTNGLCHKKVSFSDGFHDVEIRVYDDAGNYASENVNFFIDSKAPKITKTLPNQGEFSSGEFYVEFTEVNPVELVLHYGNSESGFGSVSADLGSCIEANNKMKCSADVNLDQYDGEMVDYYFELTDIVGQSAVSRLRTVEVDNTSPQISSLTYVLVGTKAEITIGVNEENLEEINYFNNNENNPKVRKFCTRLNNGVCVKRVSLVPGLNSIDLQVFDEAGNSVGQNVQIVR